MNITDLIKLSYEGVKKEAQKVIKAANKRATRLLKHETALISPAIEKARESRPEGQAAMFSSRGKDRNQLISEFKRAKSFLEAETSTIRGTIEHQKNIMAGLEQQGIEIDNSRDLVKFFKVYKRLKEQEAAAGNPDYRYDLMERIEAEVGTHANINQITAKLSAEVEEIIRRKNAMANDPQFGADIYDIYRQP